ncbi:hypothetical protein [Pragia fontium]|uniref:Fimbrial protein n=1 Tax=Pragia fontium DSM 5563 = ATCC 49100 TaxID=1122977 RepID=A0AAJ4W7Y8_9GAMM|nr:hypothetical protein [Pragia fontium]AKJ41299.1 hypothetical protein QQ39_03770 [Pragia fontium]SFC05501.1 hypothetical protein SAMN02745723_101268 [Pragia fontium DSM 5563 = ATCC 49100]VEJ53937.1 Uncharacterised protein [Pragia fontium]
MSRTDKIKYCTVWGLGLLIGLLAIRSAVADYVPPYNVRPYYGIEGSPAISNVRISGQATADKDLIATFTILASTVSGLVNCGPRNQPPGAAYHYTMIDLPRESNGRFRINENLSMSASSKFGAVNTWTDTISSTVCSNQNSKANEPAEKLTNAYPIKLFFYVKHRPIDNLVTFPSMPLGGYIRAFGAQIGETGKVYAIPIVLTGGTISLDTACTVSPQSLTIDHGGVPRGLTSHRMSAPITYTCDTPVKATFTLSYEADGNGALPLKDSSGRVGAVSKLTITDPQTGASARSIHAEIQTSKTFTVSSELSQITGSGLVSGNAWLIATHD